MTHSKAQRIPAGGLWGADQWVYGSLPSTNRWILAHASDLRHGTVIRARRQHSGRGRFDRRWITPGCCCLTLSALLCPDADTALGNPMLLPVTAIAVHDVLREFGIRSQLKWPNDVMTSRGKIAGILAEMDGAHGELVLGIGLNVNITAAALHGMRFDPHPTSMAIERQRLFDIDLVCRRLLVCLEKNIDQAWSTGPAVLLQRWKRCDYLAGQQITVRGGSRDITGRYAGVRDNGQLCVVDSAGRQHCFWSGDVSLHASATG